MITIKDVDFKLFKEYDLYEWFNDLYIDFMEEHGEVPEIYQYLRDNYSSIYNKLNKDLDFETVEDFHGACIKVLYNE